VHVPLPSSLASLGAWIADAAGIDLPVNQSQLQMLEEENVVRHPDGNALVTVFGITPTPLDEGLRRLADAQPEQLPDEGVGSLTRKRFWADIRGSAFTAEALMDHLRHHFQELTPWHLDVHAEPDTPRVPEQGMALTMQLPVRGHIQVRVEEQTPTRMTFVTLAGHPLAGAIRFSTDAAPGVNGRALRFQIDVWDRASNLVDWVSMATVGGRLQDATWIETVEKVVSASGGEAPEGVQHEARKLDEAEQERETGKLADLVVDRKREANADAIAGADADEPSESRARADADVSRPKEV
jgi:NADH dehydrogenase